MATNLRPHRLLPRPPATSARPSTGTCARFTPHRIGQKESLLSLLHVERHAARLQMAFVNDVVVLVGVGVDHLPVQHGGELPPLIFIAVLQAAAFRRSAHLS